MFIDSHAHIDGEQFDIDRDAVIQRARDAGVDEIIVIGAAGTLATVKRAVALAESTPGVHATVGVHPHDACNIEDDWWPEIEAMARRASVCGVGETGLDYHYRHSTPAQQESAFRRHVALARGCGKPLVCHIRDAHAQALSILDGADDVGGVIHCFTGGPEDAAAYVALGFYVSFSGIVTFRGADSIRAAVKSVPLDRILLETDCPYLAPIPHRGGRNEPAYLVHTAQVVADLAGLPVADLGRQTSANTRELFGLTTP